MALPQAAGSALPLFYNDHFDFPLPAGHKFPLAKYRSLRQELARDSRFSLIPAPIVEIPDLLRVHEAGYVFGFLSGELEPKVFRRIGFPWSEELVKRTLSSVGATCAATKMALATGFSGTLAGGTHHAFRGEGAGFCVFNDLAVAAECVRANHFVKRIGIVDCDVHQGDGTAVIFREEANIFTLSLHSASNFPLRKQTSRLDVELPDGCDDRTYLAALDGALEELWAFRPELVLFQSGVDTLATDRLGRMQLTMAGLRERDRRVIGKAKRQGIPLVTTLGGGYSEPIELTVNAHAQTFRVAAELNEAM